MKLDELITQLNAVMKEAGNLDVVITGQYAASTDTIYGVDIGTDYTYTDTNGKVCLIDTDLMTG